MSDVSVGSDRFWRECDPRITATLSDAQRAEIERVLQLSSEAGAIESSDLRLSFRWFFVRIVWGLEKRHPERIKREQQLHPALAPRNAPMLASLLIGSVAFWGGAVALSAVLFAYFVS